MSKKNKIIMIIGIVLVALLILVFISVFLLTKDDYRAMQYKDFVDFETEEIFKNNRDYLLISGRYYGSSLRIKKVKVHYDNSDAIVNIYTTLFSENDSSFLYPIELKDSVSRVLFGNEKKIIWEKVE